MSKNLLVKMTISTGVALLFSHSAFAAPQDSHLIKVDGSSTVYPITEAVAEEFGEQHAGLQVTVGISGTGGGFKKFCAGEIDISDASRPIKKEELELCKKNGVEFVELPIAYDALSVVVNPKNSWAKTMTVAELKKIFDPAAQGKVTKWSQVRQGWPEKPLAVFAPGVDSGTYDYFTEAVVGQEHASRGDITSSEDDNVLVQGISGNEGAIGFFGMAYYEENKDKLNSVAIDDGNPANGAGPQLPTVENVEKSVYQPLARPLFIYVSKASLARPEIQQFVSYYLGNVSNLAAEVGYIKLPTDVVGMAKARLDKQVEGSIFASGGSQVGVTLIELLKKETI